MNVGTMRAVDRYVGVPCCWITGIWNTLFDRKISAPGTPGSILVIKFFGMGSILLSAPFLAHVRQQLPSAKIFFLSFSSNKELLERLPYSLEVLTISTQSIFSFAADILSVLRRLRRESLDVVCDLEFFSKFSTLLSVFSGAATRIGYELPTFWRRTNITHPIPLDHSQHVSKVFLRQLEGMNLKMPETPRPVRLAPQANERISMQTKLSLEANGFEVIPININAGPTSLERRWDGGRFMQVVQGLLDERPGRKFFFIGSEDERAYISRILARHAFASDRTVNCAGLLSLGELMALLERSTFLLTNDSGPMHLASAVGTTTIALFGPESPGFYGPMGNAHVVYKGIECSPCLNVYNAKLFKCPYNARCMNEISVRDVFAAIRTLDKSPLVAAE